MGEADIEHFPGRHDGHGQSRAGGDLGATGDARVSRVECPVQDDEVDGFSTAINGVIAGRRHSGLSCCPHDLWIARVVVSVCGSDSFGRLDHRSGQVGGRGEQRALLLEQLSVLCALPRIPP